MFKRCVVPNKLTNRLGHRSSKPLVTSRRNQRTKLSSRTVQRLMLFLHTRDAVRIPASNNGTARREAVIKNFLHCKSTSRPFLTATPHATITASTANKKGKPHKTLNKLISMFGVNNPKPWLLVFSGNSHKHGLVAGILCEQYKVRMKYGKTFILIPYPCS